MIRATFDVSAAVASYLAGDGATVTQQAQIFEPPASLPAKGVLLCLPGGTYAKDYWFLEVPGHPGYSFAEHLTRRGYIVVAVDHIGVGGSSDPLIGPLTLRSMAAGDAEVARQVRSRLSEGSLLSGLASVDLPLYGVGHSMGACIATIAQAQFGGFDALVLLGYGVHKPNVENAVYADRQIDEAEAIFRRSSGIPDEELFVWPPRNESLRPRFYGPDVPLAVVLADEAAASRLPVRAATEVMIPGFVEAEAASIDVPIFLGFGEIGDNSPDPLGEPLHYRACTDVTVFVLQGSGHCHNFSGRRSVLWDRIAAWLPGAVGRAHRVH